MGPRSKKYTIKQAPRGTPRGVK